MTRLQLRLLGGFEVRDSGGQPVAFARKKAEAVLAYLALRPGQPQRRDAIASLLWGDASDEKARHSLRQVLVSLRQTLARAESQPLREQADTVTLDPAALEVDVCSFERLLADGTPDALAEASLLYRGELLAGIGVHEPAFEDWLLSERERMREQAIQAFSRLLEHQQARGSTNDAIGTAVRLLAMDRTLESVHRSLMLLYARQGRRGAARRQYQACLAALEQEFGTPPEDETRLLYRELLRARTTETNAAPPPLGRTIHAQPAASGMPLSGRDRELAQLRELRKEISQGRGASVVILGDGGIGKSRLIEALVHEAEDAGTLVLIGRAWEAERNLPFGPWVHAFRAAGVMPDLAAGLDPQSRRELARLFPELGSPPGDAPAEDHLHLFEAMASAIRCLSRRGPLVVVIEDLHWADEMTQRLLAYLAGATSGWPVLLATTARPDEVRAIPLVERMLAEIGRQPRSRQIALAPISRADTLAVVTALMRAGADEQTLRELGEKAWRISKGNPFLVTETVRAARDVDDSQPETPQGDDVVAERLERLTGIAAQLAAAAAVIGREFDLELLARAAELNLSEAADGVAELVERRLLHSAGELLDFTHDHIRAAAYGRLTKLHRRMLHGAVARALEELHAADLAPHYLALGRHCFESERWERAFQYLHDAGRGAAARAAHREAVASFEQALAACARLPQNPQRMRAAIDVSFDLRGSLTMLGDLKGTLACLRAAEPHARNLGDPLLQAWIAIFSGNCLTAMGRHAEAIEMGERARAIAAAGAVTDLEDCWTTNVLGTSRFFLGEFRQAQGLLRSAAAASVGDAGYRKRGVIGHPGVISHGWLALCYAETGDFDQAFAHAASALAIAERHDWYWDTVRACFAAGVVHVRRGDFSYGIRVLRHGVELARVRDLPMGTRMLTPILGSGLAGTGEFAQAVDLLAPVAAAPVLPYCLNFVAKAYFLAGRLDEAAGIAARALEQGNERNEPGVRAWALWLQGCIAGRKNKAAGIAQLRQALALADEREMRPLAAHCHLELGEIERAVGLYEEMGMTHWALRARNGRASV